MLLFQLLGVEGMRQFGNEPAAACMDDAMLSFVAICEAVESFFQKPVKRACTCLDLHNCHQGQRESRAEFIATLRELLPHCKFDVDHQKEHLAMQLLAGCCSDAARKQMLLEDIINLDKYVEILLPKESAVADIAAFWAAVRATSTSSASVGAVNPHMQSKGQQQGKGRDSKQGVSTGQKQDKGNVTCFSCVKKGHYTKTDKCPAKNAECSFCHKSGHWAGVCQTKEQSKLASNEHKGGSAKKIEPHTKSIIPGTSIEQVYCFTVKILDSKGNSHSLTAEVDSGSYCSTNSCDFFDRELWDIHLKPLIGPSFAYGGVPITRFNGLITVQVESGGQVCSSNLMVSSVESQHIIGRDLINCFGLAIRGSSWVLDLDQPDAISMVHSLPSFDAVHALMHTTRQ